VGGSGGLQAAVAVGGRARLGNVGAAEPCVDKFQITYGGPLWAVID
jgi:hypothetical protein